MKTRNSKAVIDCRVSSSVQVKKCGRPLQPFEDTFRTAMTFLRNPIKLWSSDRLEDKRMVLRVAFAEKLPYQRNKGFRTAQPALPFTLLMALNESKGEVVQVRGESSNRRFQVLEEWNAILQGSSLYTLPSPNW